MALVFVLLDAPPQAASNKTLRQKVKQLNVLGVLFLVPSIVSLCLALQWGGTMYAVSHTNQAWKSHIGY